MSNIIEHKYDNKTIETIKNMYAKGSTNDEFVVFITLCQKYNLDPMLNEIYFIRRSDKATFMTSRDGYLKIANRDPYFDGMDSDVIYEGDVISKKNDGGIHIVYGDNHLKFDNTKITGAFCNVYRKDRAKCSSALVSFKNYNKQGPIWKSNPDAMILKVAESTALRKAFAINGLGGAEEIDDKQEVMRQPEDMKPAAINIQTGEIVDTQYLNREQWNTLVNELKTCTNGNALRDEILVEYDIEKLSKLLSSDYEQALQFIKDNKENI